MLKFAAAVFFLIITPGPGVLTTAGVGAGFGARPGLIFVIGLFFGTNLVALAVVTGLAGVLFSVPYLRGALFAISAIYLLYLAAKVGFSGAKIGFMATPKAPGLAGGVMLQLINPKAYAVNTMMFTGFNYWPGNLAAELITKFLIMNAIWVPLHLAWLWAGVALHRLDLAPRVQRRINLAMAAAMVLVVVLAVLAG